MTLDSMPAYSRPTAYWIYRADIYNGTFRNLVDDWGNADAFKFYLQCAEKVSQIKLNWGIVHTISGGLLDLLENFFIDNEINTYQNQVGAIYLQGVQTAANIVKQIDAAFGEITDTYNQAKKDAQNLVDQAKAQSQSMVNQVTDHINQDIIPAVNDAEAKAKAATDKINGDVNNAINTINSQVQKAQSDLNGVINQVNNVINSVNASAKNISNLQTQAQNTITQLNQAIDTLNKSVIPSLNTHTSQIKDLYGKIGQAVPNQPTQGKTLKQVLGLE